MQTKAQMIKEILKSALGLFIFSIGVYLTIQANIGLAPWDCLSMGVSARVGYSYGIVHTVISILIVLIDVLLKEKIGYGTILDALLVGNYVDFIGYFNLVPVSKSIPLSCIMVIVGLFIMGYGQYFYMDAAQGCGPRDSLLIALGKRFPRTPIGIVQTVIVGIALLIGWLLGGPVGIGTVISVFGMGTALQIVCKLLHFEPRNVVHKNVLETNKILFQK
ncbi:YczE/YyaS/YitT family protein [Anaerotignum sp.]